MHEDRASGKRISSARSGAGGAMNRPETIMCVACGTPVEWDEAVASRADEVVHARCQPLVKTTEPEEDG